MRQRSVGIARRRHRGNASEHVSNVAIVFVFIDLRRRAVILQSTAIHNATLGNRFKIKHKKRNN